LAPLTDRIKLGSLVLCNSFRNPALLAKMAASLDVISKGRLEFAIGAGWHKAEYIAYGYEFPDARTRIRQLEEGVKIIRLMWTEEHPSFDGEYFSIRDANCEPRPIQKPHPPITVGGGGEKYTLKVVAKYADRCNLIGSVKTCRQKLTALKTHCSTVGRNYDDIEKSLFSYIHIGRNEADLKKDMRRIYDMSRLSQPFEEWYKNERQRVIAGTTEDCIERIKEFEQIGFTFFILRFYETPSVERIRQVHDQILQSS
jgi:alkanesulfonate monooxygenase SsuD/methylene tetrahydromethanopterin reductase-like flavin-dependent oxidoreductase (luciferase family)